ncbi:MAG: MBL fold metallo-hydrolase, partial [Acidimicrobiia bacterium]
TEEALEQVMRPPWFPATFTGTPAAKRFVDLDSEEVRLGALRVRWARLQHPSGVTGYRFERAGGRW